MGALLIAFAGSFVLGMVPAAWIVVRLHTRRDLGTSGSGNVGALNAMRVSRSRGVGVAVLLLDGAKGALATWLAPHVGGAEALHLQCAACLGVVAGHDYNLVLSVLARRLVGGKGFAAAGGSLLVLGPWLVVVWLLVVAVVYAVLRAARGIRDESPAAAAATLAMIPAGAWLLGAAGAALGTGLTLLIAPKLVREVHAHLFPGTPAGSEPGS